MLSLLDISKLASIVKAGGITFYVLAIISVISISIILYKFCEFALKSSMSRARFVSKIAAAIKKANTKAALDICQRTSSPMGPVAKSGIMAHLGKHSVSEAMDREIMIETVKLEKFTTVLGTIGSVSVYIGLFGTVLGIIRAFHDMSTMGSGGISVVISGVSEALIATAAGLFVAVPAVIAYNFIMKGIDKFVVNMEYCASAVESLLNVKKQTPTMPPRPTFYSDDFDHGEDHL
ncbi:MAG: MotA/TolQ/ExbB proton channel family protein [Elusimicrobiota bacterium]|jgi:biopolymer transport protein ExbB/TolQ|nr:MotA/TolQ/ExbB proton channel family protein [Elusimicrobiota bacterium]